MWGVVNVNHYECRLQYTDAPKGGQGTRDGDYRRLHERVWPTSNRTRTSHLRSEMVVQGSRSRGELDLCEEGPLGGSGSAVACGVCGRFNFFSVHVFFLFDFFLSALMSVLSKFVRGWAGS